MHGQQRGLISTQYRWMSMRAQAEGYDERIQGWVPNRSLSNNNASGSFGLTMGLEDLLEGGGERQSTMWTGLVLERERWINAGTGVMPQSDQLLC